MERQKICLALTVQVKLAKTITEIRPIEMRVLVLATLQKIHLKLAWLFDLSITGNSITVSKIARE